MNATFPLVLAGLSLALAAHPFTTYPLSLAVLRRLRRPDGPVTPAATARPLHVSLLVCAHNEERVIEDKIRNLQALMDRALSEPSVGEVEALVYVDGSSDRTAAILKACPDPRLRTFVATRRTGKTAGLNRLVEIARGDVLVLSDANVTVEPDALARLAVRFADAAVGLVCGHLRYVNGEVNATARNGAVYWRLEETIRQLESDTGGAIGADGSLYAVRKDLWPGVPEDLIDDFYVPMTVRFQGRRVIRAAEILAFERTAEDGADEFRRKVRIACQAFNVHRRIWPLVRGLPWRDQYKYVSHKLLKWLIGCNLALAGLALGLATALAFGAATSAGAAGLLVLILGAGSALRIRPLPAAADALQMFAAVTLGLVRSLQGQRFVTWQPADSVRSGSMTLVPPPPGRAS